MRRRGFGVVLAAAMLAAGGAWAQAEAPAEPRPAAQSEAQSESDAIRGVIASQIEAFEADDFEAAFGFASPGIQRLFGDPARFGMMVRSGYPMVWRPASVRFAGLAGADQRRVQTVVVTDQAGAVFALDYEMIPGEGGWRIDGVTIRRTGETGA